VQAMVIETGPTDATTSVAITDCWICGNPADNARAYVSEIRFDVIQPDIGRKRSTYFVGDEGKRRVKFVIRNSLDRKRCYKSEAR
jgi:hypothetical protein